MAVFTSAPPSRAGSVRWSASFIIPASAWAVPSMVFSATFPVKPSVTITSISPPRRSRPSQYPWKRIPERARASAAARVSAVPFVASSPFARIATLGRDTPSTRRE